MSEGGPTFPGLGVGRVELVAEVYEIFESVLLPEAHKFGVEGFLGSGRDFVDLEAFFGEDATLRVLHDVAALQAFPIEVAVHFRVE